MDNFVAELKRKIRIEDVISETVPLERHSGRGFTRGGQRGAGEHSLVVDLDGQRFAWNGNSEYGGGQYNDVITWVMIRDRVDFRKALELLARKANMELPKWNQEQEVKYAAVRRQEAVLDVAQRTFAGWLLNDEKALAYARGRGWTDETIKAAGLGFTGWGTDAEYELMKNALAAADDLHAPAVVAVIGLKGGVKVWCEKRGVTPKQSWIDNDRIPSMLGWGKTVGLIYPCIYFGRTSYLYRRHLKLDADGTTLIGSDEPKSYNLPKELVGERQVYFNHKYSPRAERVALIEGPGDAVTLGQWNMAAVSIAGTAWGDHEALLRQLREQHEAVYIGLDADQAGSDVIRGKNGEWPLVDIVGPMCRKIEWPEKDPNDWLKIMVKAEVTHADQLQMVAQQVGAAKPLAIEVAKWAGSQTDDHNKSKALTRAFQVIAQMGDENIINQYAADFLGAFRPLGETVKGMREFTRLLKKAMGKGDDDAPREEVIYTYGGRIGDWLLEYCYDDETGKARFAYRDPSGRVDEADELVIDGKKYKPKWPDDKMITKGAIQFPSGLSRKDDGSIDRKSTRELTTIISITIKKNYLFTDMKWPYLAAYWIMGTWMYDNFTELVYLRMVGDAGAGKSALLNLIGAMCYRSIKMSGADSESTFFRVVDDFRGTILFEEADLPENSDASNPIVKFVNLGAMKGNFIYRNEEFIDGEGNKGWRPTPFETYCPKMFAMRGDFMDNAVASRAISLKLTSAETSQLKEANIPLRLSRGVMKSLKRIQNLCLTWRLHEYQLLERELGWDLVDVEIPARFNQVTMPMKSLAVNIDGTRDEDFVNQITMLLRSHYQEIVNENSTSWNARTLEAMWKLYSYSDLWPRLVIKNDGEIFMKVGDITALVNNIADEMNEDGDDLRIRKAEFETFKTAEGEERTVEKKNNKKKFEKTSQSIGKILREEFQLFFPPRTGKGFMVLWDETKIVALSKKYGALPDAEKIEKARQGLAALRAKTAKPSQLEMPAEEVK